MQYSNDKKYSATITTRDIQIYEFGTEILVNTIDLKEFCMKVDYDSYKSSAPDANIKKFLSVDFRHKPLNNEIFSNIPNLKLVIYDSENQIKPDSFPDVEILVVRTEVDLNKNNVPKSVKDLTVSKDTRVDLDLFPQLSNLRIMYDSYGSFDDCRYFIKKYVAILRDGNFKISIVKEIETGSKEYMNKITIDYFNRTLFNHTLFEQPGSQPVSYRLSKQYVLNKNVIPGIITLARDIEFIPNFHPADDDEIIEEICEQIRNKFFENKETITIHLNNPSNSIFVHLSSFDSVLYQIKSNRMIETSHFYLDRNGICIDIKFKREHLTRFEVKDSAKIFETLFAKYLKSFSESKMIMNSKTDIIATADSVKFVSISNGLLGVQPPHNLPDSVTILELGHGIKLDDSFRIPSNLHTIVISDHNTEITDTVINKINILMVDSEVASQFILDHIEILNSSAVELKIFTKKIFTRGLFGETNNYCVTDNFIMSDPYIVTDPDLLSTLPYLHSVRIIVRDYKCDDDIEKQYIMVKPLTVFNQVVEKKYDILNNFITLESIIADIARNIASVVHTSNQKGRSSEIFTHVYNSKSIFDSSIETITGSIKDYFRCNSDNAPLVNFSLINEQHDDIVLKYEVIAPNQLELMQPKN